MTYFILEHKEAKEPQLDNEKTFLSALSYNHWSNGDKCEIFAYSLYKNNSIHDLYSSNTGTLSKALYNLGFYKKVLYPIGSVEFSNRILKAQGYNQIKPIEFPSILRDDKSFMELGALAIMGHTYDYTSDQFTGLYEANRIIEKQFNNINILKDIKENRLFLIKSMTTIKSSSNGVYRLGDKLLNSLPKDKYYITPWLGDRIFIAEYRVIVYRGEIVSIRPYIGDTLLVIPDKLKIQEFILKYKNAPPAYSIDVGITMNGATVLIEIHNYISLGSYGFDNESKFIPMTVQAFNWEINNHK